MAEVSDPATEATGSVDRLRRSPAPLTDAADEPPQQVEYGGPTAMTRLISGSAGGRRLSVPPGNRTRPTADRVREALFSTISAEVGSLGGLRFLDLYAGSGAVGLEAVSRGAAHALVVEDDARALRTLRANIRSLGLAEVEVAAERVERRLQTPPATPYDVAFLDPPYSLEAPPVDAVLAALASGAWLATDALVAVERSSRTPGPTWPPGLLPLRTRRYGEAALWYGRAGSGQDHPTGPDG